MLCRPLGQWPRGFLLSVDDLDIIYMGRAVELAEKGRGCTHPNPLVGAVVVRDGQVVAEGYHAGPGLDHAEVAALKQVDDARGATLYVTLEPCCSYGRTPPCTSALIQSGLVRVVVGAIDPSPQVNGQGVAQLRAAGIEVDLAEGEIALRCKRQNNGFRKAVVTGLPFVSYKYAMTLDGRAACDSGDSRWVSGEESRALVHRLRSVTDAVVVGAGTLRADDPLLTARGVGCRRQPLRVVVDGRLTIPRDAALVRSKEEGAVLIVCSGLVDDARRTEVESWGIETAVVGRDGGRETLVAGHRPAVAAAHAARQAVETLATDAQGDEWRVSPRSVARLLGSRGIQSVLMEGGPRLAGSWWSAGLVDQVIAFISPRIVSGTGLQSPLVGIGGTEMACATALREVQTRVLGDDLCVSGYVGEAY
jgi:diaminohydroxyphosphoribosylaminopyrimidine deaminase/5-amino-6-(5-phosphoribosylamino)uracil reductase